MIEPTFGDWQDQKEESRRLLQEQREAEAQRVQQQANETVQASSEEQPTRFTSGRGEGRSAFATNEERQQRVEQQQQLAEEEAQRRAEEGDPVPQGERGWITEAGELIQQALDYPSNKASELTGGLIPNADQQRQNFMDAGPAGEVIVGGGQGIEAGTILLPLTAAGRATGQQTPWSQPPAILDNSPSGKAAFNIMEVLAPSLIAGAALPPGLTQTAGFVATESAVETVVATETVDDVAGGRTVARNFGVIADSLGYDGDALTRELIAGESFKSQAFVAVLGYLQNLGLNVGVNQLIRVLRPSKTTDEIIDEVLDGKPQGEIIQPQYKPDAEPHEVLTIDTVSPTAPPTAGRQFVSDEVLTPDYVRNLGSDSKFFTDADRRVFASLDQVSTREGMDNLLQETIKRLESFDNAVADEAGAKATTLEWWSNNADLIRGGDYDAGAFNFASDADLVRTTRSAEGVQEIAPSKSIEDYLRERAQVTPEGALASALVGDVMGSKGIKLATLANNLDTNGIDFTNVVNEFARVTDRYALFSIPERRGARDWFLGGALRQKSRIESAKNAAGVTNTPKGSDLPRGNAPGRDFEPQLGESQSTFSELWIRAQEGDYDALNTVKEYMRAVAVMPPEKALGGISKLEDVAKANLKDGNSEAATSLMYAGRITSLSTQAVSAGSTVARFLAEPIGNIISPVFARGSMSDVMYGLGALKGSFSSLAEGMRIARQTFASEIPVNSGSKFDDGIRNSAKKAAQMDAAIKEYRRQLSREGKDAFNSMEALTAEIQYNIQRFANSPINRLGARLLTAGDDGFKVALGAQVANGRAYRLATEAGKLKDLDSFIKVEMDKVFREGVETGRITDGEVIQAGKNLTFQDDIPIKGNMVDRVFESAQGAANNSAPGKYFLPFVRAAYTSLELTARYEPSGILRNMVPKYKRILNEVNPTTGMPTARAQQLQGQIAFGRLTALTTVGGAYFGNVTGYNHPDPKMRTKILIPYNNKDGYIAIDYSRVEPFASIIGVTADVVNSVKDGSLSEGDLQRFAEEMVFSIAMGSTDKTFMRGLLDFGALIDYKNPDGRFFNTAGKLTQDLLTLPFGAVGALTRQGGRILAPNDAITMDETNPLMNYFSGLKGRFVGGVGSPVKHDILTGEAIRFTPDTGNPIGNALGGLINQALPINITASRQSPVIKELGRLGFNLRDIKTDTYKGVPLTPQQQSDFTKAIAEAGLEDDLQAYFDSSGYESLRRGMNRNRSAIGTTGKGTNADVIRQEILTEVRGIIKDALDRGANDSILNDPDFINRQYGQDDSLTFNKAKNGSVQALLNMPNK